MKKINGGKNDWGKRIRKKKKGWKERRKLKKIIEGWKDWLKEGSKKKKRKEGGGRERQKKNRGKWKENVGSKWQIRKDEWMDRRKERRKK